MGISHSASLALQQALNAQAAGDLPAALDLSNQAVTIGEASVKAGRQGAAYLPIFLVRRSDIERQVHRTDEAAADAARAVSLLQAAAQPGTSSSNLGRAYLALGRALQAESKLDEARAGFRSAAEQLQSTLGPDHPDSRSARQFAAEYLPANKHMPITC